MRPNNQNGKRSRGRARRPSGFNQPNVNRNTTFESNGPEGKLRGNAQQLFEKYTALAQDANSSSERISAEAFSQFADHYYRVHQTILAAMEQKRNTHENKSEPKQKSFDDASSSTHNDGNADKEIEADAKNKISEVKGFIREIEVWPNQEVEWWFVPIKAGQFTDLLCKVKDKISGSLHSDMGMVGKIIIE